MTESNITKDLRGLAKPISKFTPDPANARKHDERSYEVIANSLRQFQQRKPIVAQEKDGQWIVRAGNGTLEAAKRLGWTEIAAVIVNEDSVISTAFAISDNRSAEISTWDDDVLKKTLSALMDEGVVVEDFGFDIGDLGLGMEGSGGGLTDPDEVPEVAQNIHNVKLGDIWVLGNHRLMCGDSTVKENVERLMDGKKADITFTSPPYNEAKNSHLHNYDKSFSGKYKNNDDAMCDDDYVNFLAKSCDLALIMSDYVFWNIQLLAHNKMALVRWLAKYDTRLKDVLIWNKKQCPPNIVKGAFNTKFEFVFVFADGKKNATRGFPVTWQGQYPNVIDTENNSGNDHAEDHRAGFPVAFPMWALDKLDFVKSVYEPFCGTGTTLIACEKTNRTCYGMELDPHYCSVIIERWQQFTGKTAILESNNTGAS